MKFAFLQNVSVQENILLEPLHVLDSLVAVEIVSLGFDVSFSANAYRIVGQSIRQLGIMPIVRQILTIGALTAEILDVTGNTIALIEGVKLGSRSLSVGARATATESYNFVGITANDEAGS